MKFSLTYLACAITFLLGIVGCRNKSGEDKLLYSVTSQYNLSNLSDYTVCLFLPTRREGCDICVMKVEELLEKYADQDSLLLILTTRHPAWVNKGIKTKHMLIDTKGIAISRKIVYGYPKAYILVDGNVTESFDVQPDNLKKLKNEISL